MADQIVTIDEVEVNEGASDYVHGGNLDTPRVGFTADSYSLLIEGWVLTLSLAVEHVEVLHQERPVALAEANLERPDIASAYPEVEGSSRAGYRVSIGTLKLAASFEIVLRAKLEDGTRLPLGRLRGRRRPLPAAGAEELQPLMVNTIGRSGSTLLVTQLSSHPDVVAFSPFVKDARISTYWTNVLQDLAEPSSFLAPFDPPDLEMPQWWLKSGTGELGDPEVERWLGGGAIDSLAAVCRSRIEAFYRELVVGDESPRYFVEKYMPHQVVPDLLIEMYPGAREVILVRDFRDMLCSVLAFNRKRGWEAFGTAEAGSDVEYVRTALAQSAATLAGRLRGNGETPHLIRYEDLIQDPVPALTGLFEYLKLDADPDRVAETVRRAEASTASMQHHRTTSDPAASIGRWREDLPPEVAEACNEALGPLLAEFGYEAE
jgi:hypothetical protein